jgi:hypothetical protein
MTTIINNKLEQKYFFFGIVIFLIAAIAGWIKLPLGFNFIDEGMYMVDGWRLTQGDRLFPDASTNVIFMYSTFNAAIFSLFPDITLLGFRKIQYFLSFFSILLLSYSIFRHTKQFWYLPYIFSYAIYSGLDPIGMTTNMNYYTYPHCFLTLHVSFLLLALSMPGSLSRSIFLLLSGISIWSIGFSLLPLSVVAAAPLVTMFIVKRCNTFNHISFTIKDLFLVLLPVVFLWGLFISFYNIDFIEALQKTFKYSTETGIHRATFNYVAFLYISITLIIFYLSVNALELFKGSILLIAACIGSVIYTIINSNLFSLVPGFWREWFTGPMWFSSLLISFIFYYLINVGFKIYKKHRASKIDTLILIILIPSVTFVAIESYSSKMGSLSGNHAALPLILALGLFISNLMPRLNTPPKIIAGFFAILAPFMVVAAVNDWRFTYFDLKPELLTHTIKSGFAKNIKTNVHFHNLAKWIEKTSEDYSQPGDFAIFIETAPMGYMLANRRPSLNHSWTGLGKSPSLRKDAITQMIISGREPSIAYRLLKNLMLFPADLKKGTFTYPYNYRYMYNDPINNYLKNHMKPIEQYVINGEKWIEVLVPRMKK